jgi:hypothetical protein
MNPTSDERLGKLKVSLLEGMREYMPSVDGSYQEADVQRCGEILDQFGAAISGAVGREDALAHVRTAVLDLNALNERCGGSLIETDQREMLCELIIATVARRGFISPEEDVTFAWREW